ncbi:MAG: transcriptional regulator [Bacteroidota bacterium]
MKEIITKLQKAFDHRVRLGAMSMLMVNEWVDFTTLRDNLEVSDGNLASHLKNLEKQHYIELRKQFIGRRPNTSYRATEAGKKAFLEHLDYLERIITRVQPGGSREGE